MPTRFEVSVVLDESGSMSANIDGALDGVNEFFRTLREQPAHLRVSLLTFADRAAYIYQRIYLADLHDVTIDDYRPAGGTALYDSVLQAVADLEPVVGAEGRAIVVIMTDGDDTGSHATMDAVKRVVEAKTATGRWTFLYFGPDGKQVGKGMGILPAYIHQLTGSSEEIKAAFEVAADETVKLLTAGSGVFNL